MNLSDNSRTCAARALSDGAAPGRAELMPSHEPSGFSMGYLGPRRLNALGARVGL